VLATSTEQARRFNSEVANLLLAAVPHAVHVRRLEFVLCCLELLLLCCWQRLLRLSLGIHVVEDRLEITLLELQNLNLVAVLVLSVTGLVQHFFESGEEVLLESRVLHVVRRVKHTAKSVRNFFGLRIQLDGYTVVEHHDVAR
jgi:hypothetical protein